MYEIISCWCHNFKRKNHLLDIVCVNFSLHWSVSAARLPWAVLGCPPKGWARHGPARISAWRGQDWARLWVCRTEIFMPRWRWIFCLLVSKVVFSVVRPLLLVPLIIRLVNQLEKSTFWEHLCRFIIVYTRKRQILKVIKR